MPEVDYRSAQDYSLSDSQSVPISELQITDSPRFVGVDTDHIRVLAEVEESLPPIIVHRSTMRVLDGVHRLRAAQLLDRTEIVACFFDGDDADAFVLSVERNISHGQPLSRPERGVERPGADRLRLKRGGLRLGVCASVPNRVVAS
ncbi:ParB/RepB/Spo0J family partition protein [Nocardia sp. NPDC051321]|uniref:ParB/RepB/Spo0J family partition protein n=1 Tax=Nocardia sp. NPDC051321 TaxID=3364323 RepID=UPI00379B04A4